MKIYCLLGEKKNRIFLSLPPVYTKSGENILHPWPALTERKSQETQDAVTDQRRGKETQRLNSM